MDGIGMDLGGLQTMGIVNAMKTGKAHFDLIIHAYSSSFAYHLWDAGSYGLLHR